MSKGRVLGGGLVLGIALLTACVGAMEPDKPYQSPYRVKFTQPLKELLADIDAGARGDPKEESSIAVADWYSRSVREKYQAWGPPTKHYPEADVVRDRSAAWKRERTIAVALRFVGYGYQHHHVPDWDPPADWPWKPTGVGRNGKGVDCSNFTAFVFNLGFGLKPTGEVKNQSELKEFPGPGGERRTKVQRIELPGSYDKLRQTLKTGDLLFIRNREEQISHVVFWVGAIGAAPDDVPLILDSHGDGVKDSRGETIPCGIQLRPFHERSWYYKSASHALRVWQDE